LLTVDRDDLPGRQRRRFVTDRNAIHYDNRLPEERRPVFAFDHAQPIVKHGIA